MTAASIAIVTTGATLFVTVLLFTAEWIRRRVVAYRENRRQIITRTLDTMDRAIRGFIRTSLFPVGSRVELEYMVLVPRLLVDLPKKERFVAAWVAREVQSMLAQSSDDKAFKISVDISAKLVEWYHHDRKRDWFKADLSKRPYDPMFVQPPRVKRIRMWHAGIQWLKLTSLSAIVVLAIGYTANSFRKKPR
jgi:hypothetical protein